MTIIRLSSVFVIVVMATKMLVFVAEDAKMLEVEWLSELDHEVDELIDEAVRYRGERREVVERGERFARSMRRDAIRFGIELLLRARVSRRWLADAFDRDVGESARGLAVSFINGRHCGHPSSIKPLCKQQSGFLDTTVREERLFPLTTVLA